MSNNLVGRALEAFQHAERRVPAYRILLAEAGICREDIRDGNDFLKLPILEKKDTFQRFPIEQLCVDGTIGHLGTVLTSSGHSGIFAFGLTGADALSATVEWIDDALDTLFQVRSKPTLLINCLPMGVKVHTRACTLAETSVRADMAIGLVKAFGGHFSQLIFVGEAAFIKHLLEMGRDSGVNWKDLLIHVIVGEEPLAENARRYLEGMLGADLKKPAQGMIVSSMGVAELGLNLFSEAPPIGQLPLLRRVLHENTSLRHALLGRREWVPSLFAYDSRRIFVEFDAAGRLLVTTLDLGLRVPLVRYATGDCGGFIHIPPRLRPAIESLGVSCELLDQISCVMIEGRGQHALAGNIRVYPEEVKEGIYADPSLAVLTTANFRLVSGDRSALVRIQLSPTVTPSENLDLLFFAEITRYVSAPIRVSCERYEDFGSGMALDYERKFAYLGR